tara:strand:+ start:63 stop:227 length:165 start_codon:yes stop_codon:yes gene_type:complete
MYRQQIHLKEMMVELVLVVVQDMVEVAVEALQPLEALVHLQLEELEEQELQIQY